MRTWIILACLGAFALYWSSAVVGWWTQPIATFFGRREFWWDAEDFAVFYAAGTIAARGDLGAVYDANAHASLQLPLLVNHSEPLGFYNPPLFALLFVPFSWLAADVAFQAWTLVNVALALVMCALLWRVSAPISPGFRAVIILGFLTMYPLPFGLRLGQFSLILAVSWALAYLCLREGRPRAAGLALAPLLVKPELLIPVTLFLAWKRQWESLRILLAITVLAVGASVAMLGPFGSWDYATHIANAAGDGAGNMYGWNGVLASTFAPDRPGSMTYWAAPLVLATLAAAALMWRGDFDGRNAAFPAQWLALTLATLLWDSHLYLQDLIVIAPAAVAAFASSTGWRRSTAGGGLLFGWMILGLGSVPSAIWGVNVFSLYMAGWLLALIAWDVGVRRRTSSERPQTRAALATEARAA